LCEAIRPPMGRGLSQSENLDKEKPLDVFKSVELWNKKCEWKTLRTGLKTTLPDGKKGGDR
jgi:hypothetical protein